MTDYEIAPLAEADIAEISARIAADDPVTAEKFLDQLFEAIELLARHPTAGHRRADLSRRALRFWTVMGAFAVVYSPKRPIEIVRVLRWRRDIRAILRRPR